MENTTPVVNEAPVTAEPTKEPVVVTPEEPTTQPATPGSKTDPNLLLKSLQEEREKRRIAEEELASIKSSVPADTEAFSDEGKLLESKIRALETKVSEVTSELTREKLIAGNPFLKDKWDDFETFRLEPENKGMNMRTAAKAFLAEHGQLEPTRKGLEKPTGGPRTPTPSGMTAEEIENLRKTNYRKYKDMLMKDQIKMQA